MSESHLNYYPDHGTNLPEYLQENIPEVQETYGMELYQTSTSTNGHHGGDGDLSSNKNSQSSVPVENASLISRSTSRTKTHEVKTVKKIIKTREVHHIGADGKPMNFSPYVSTNICPENESENFIHYKNYNNVPHDYGTYDPARPPSPAGETPRLYPHDYAAFNRTASPTTAPNSNFEKYSDAISEPYDRKGEYAAYSDYPEAGQTPLSGASPNLHRAMPQAPHSDFKQQKNYEDIDTGAHRSGGVPHGDYGTPSPTQSSERYASHYAPYGDRSEPLPAISPGFQFDLGPKGYLDRRNSYDENPSSHNHSIQHPNSTYARIPRPGYDESLAHTLSGDSRGDALFRDPDLHEIIDFLQHSNSVVRSNAAAYLTHICFMDDLVKSKAHSLGAIPPLIGLLNQDIPEIHRNACSALRNLSFGRKNDKCKRAIETAGGIEELIRLLRTSNDNEIKELITGIFYNMSSCEDLKLPIINNALNVLVSLIIAHSGYDPRKSPLSCDSAKPNEIFFSTVFRNATGVLRNISSAGEYARKKLRSCEGLIDSIVFLVRTAIGLNDMDGKCLESCVCLLRNLSYRLQEIEDPDYEKHHFLPVESRGGSAPIRAVGENLGCFGATKKKKESADKQRDNKREGIPLTTNPITQCDPVLGVALLYSPELCVSYLSLLSLCSNPHTLEAAAGAIQNITACYWLPSIDIRSCVRFEKGLPILVELLRMDQEKVVCSVARALRNLAIDARNKDLIGNYAIKDLISKLPGGSPEHNTCSDATLAAVLATLNEVIFKSMDFARSMLSLHGVERLLYIMEHGDKYSQHVVKFASSLLHNMWLHRELHESYKKAGFKESNFISAKSSTVRSSLSSPTGANSTLNRPVSSQSGTKYEDRTLPHRTEHNSNAASIPYSRSEELPLSELSHSNEPPPPSQVHRPHLNVFPSGMHQARSTTEPVYAQVNKKKGRHQNMPVQILSNDQPDSLSAGDSWV